MKLPNQGQQERIESIIHSRFYDRIRVYDVYQWLSNYEDLRKKILMFEDTNMCKIGESTTVSFHRGDYSLDAYINKIEALFERFSLQDKSD
jgi:hypothetical protein